MKSQTKMVFIKDIISHLEYLRQKKLTHDINAYMRYVKDNNTKIDGAHLTVFKLMNKLLEELEQWNISVDALIMDINKMIGKLDVYCSNYSREEDYFYNKILLGNFDGVNTCEFLNYVNVSIGNAHIKVYCYEDDIKFYCKDITEDNRVNSLHILDYQKEVHLFFNDQLN